MLYGVLTFLFIAVCLILILLILVQKGKSSMGLGNLGGGTQMLFGGSGGQDIFQKITWALGAIFMGGSLILAILKKPSSALIKRLEKQAITTQVPVPQPKMPLVPTEANTAQKPFENPAQSEKAE